MTYQMQEGYLTLGEGDWQDRSVNMLAANHLPVRGTNIVITREPLPLGVTFADYLVNQKTILSKELTGFRLLSENPDSVNEFPAHFLDITWHNQGTAMRQLILVVDLGATVLNLTATVPGEPDETTRTELLATMKSFKPGPAPVGQEGNAR
jgi:hypothetical protein